MRIAINTRILIKDRLEGVGWYTYEIVKRMVEEHPEHEFILFFDSAWDESFVFGSNVIPVNVQPPARHPFLFWIWFEVRLPALLRKYKADVFWSPDGFLSLRSRVPTLLTVHDLAFKHFPEQISGINRWYYHRYFIRFLHRADALIAVSEATRQDVLSEQVDPERVRVVYNGANARFVPAKEEDVVALKKECCDGQPYFLYVGAIHPRKNIARLVRAFTRFKKETGQPHHLILLGRMAWMANDVQEAIAASPWKEEIHSVGYQGDRLPVFYTGAEALVYVSLFEGFGIPILEAMCCETAVITSGVSSMPEVAGEAAILVNPFVESEICMAMVRMVEEKGLRTQLIEEGRQQRRKFSWDQAAHAVWDEITALHGNPKRQGYV